MISILGTLKGVSSKSKVGDDNRVIHHITVSLELSEGVERVQEIVENLKQMIQIDVVPVQPTITSFNGTE